MLDALTSPPLPSWNAAADPTLISRREEGGTECGKGGGNHRVGGGTLPAPRSSPGRRLHTGELSPGGYKAAGSVSQNVSFMAVHFSSCRGQRVCFFDSHFLRLQYVIVGTPVMLRSVHIYRLLHSSTLLVFRSKGKTISAICNY